MDLPQIAGRELVPVRLLPVLTDWRPLSPDTVAELFSGRSKIHRNWRLRSYQLLRNGQFHELLQSAWSVIDDDLAALTDELEHRTEWRDKSLLLLPPSVFVWKDELEAEYRRTFGPWRATFVEVSPNAPADYGDRLDAQFAHIDALAAADDWEALEKAHEELEKLVQAFTSLQEGAGSLTFQPLLTPVTEKVAFDGFEVLITVAQQEKNEGNPPAWAGAIPSNITEKRRKLLEQFRRLDGKRPCEGGGGRRGALADLERATGINDKNLGKLLDKAIEQERKARWIYPLGNN